MGLRGPRTYGGLGIKTPSPLRGPRRLPCFDHKSASALSVVSMSKKPGVAVYNYSMEQRWRSAGHPERSGGDHGCDERNSQNFGERAALAQAQVGQGCQSGKAEVGWLQPRPASRWPVFFKAAIFQPAAAYCYLGTATTTPQNAPVAENVDTNRPAALQWRGDRGRT